MFQAVTGCWSVSVILSIDLMLLKPYFHGTTSRIGAPFWFGSMSPKTPTAMMVSGCMASSSLRPSR